MVSKILKFGKQKGSSLMLRANGQGGSSATVLAAHFAKQNTKFGGGTPSLKASEVHSGKALLRLSASDGQARAGKGLSRATTRDSFPPTPFLFARPSLKVFQNSAFGFSLKKVPPPLKLRTGRSDFVLGCHQYSRQ